MTENQNILENISTEQLKEIKIEEVEKLLSLIKNDEELWFMDYSFADLDWDSKTIQNIESEIMEEVMGKIDEIESQTKFIEELLKTVKEVKSKNFIDEIPKEWVDLGYRADLIALNYFNENNSKESIIEEFNLDWNKVNNSFLQKYIKEEAQRLEKWWEKNSWTYLLLSYVKKETNVLADINNIHNTLQDRYINHIIWWEQWFNDLFIKWYSNESSNYLMKISDFEEFLSRPNTEIIWDNNNPNVVNSRALANYFLYLENKNTLNIDTLRQKMSIKKIDDLYKIWSSNTNSIAKEILNNSWVWEELEKIHSQIEPISNLRAKNQEYIEEINKKDAEYLYKNQDLIILINNEEKLLSVLKIFEEKSKTLEIKDINPVLKWNLNIIRHENIDLWYWWLQEIPKNILEDNLWVIIRKYRKNSGEWMLNELLTRSVYLWVDSNELARVIKDFNITVHSEYVKNYIWEYLQIDKNNFKSILSKYNYLSWIWEHEVIKTIDQEDLKTITSYIIQNIDNSYAQYYMTKFIWLWYLWEWAAFITTPTNNIKLNKTLIEYNFGFFYILPKEMRWDKDIIDTFLKSLWQKNSVDGNNQKSVFDKETYMKNIQAYFSVINTDDINRFLQVIKFSNENSIWEWWIKEMPLNVKEKLFNDKAIALIIWNIEKWINWNIEDEYKDTYDELINFVSENQYAIYYKNEHNQIRDKADEYKNNKDIDKNKVLDYKDKLKELLSSSNLDKSDSDTLNETIDNVLSDWEINSEKMNTIYLTITTELKYEWLDNEEKKQKIGEILKIVTESFNEKLEQQEEELKEDISKSDLSSIIKEEYRELLIIKKENENWEIKEYINSEELNKIFNQLIQWKSHEEITEIKNQILDKYFYNLVPEEKENILKLFETYTLQTETKYANEKTDLIIDYYSSNRSDISFRDYLVIEKWINIEEEVRIIEEKEKLDNSTNNNYNNTEIYNQTIETKWYNPETWVIENNGNKIELNIIEKQIVESNPEAIDNIVDFYNLLNDIWLSKLWKIKDQIFNSISNVEWIWFNVDWDYLNENETKIFINKILKSLWIDEIPTVLNIKNFKWEVLDINKTQVSWEQERDFIYWETYLENMFIEKYYPRWSVMELLNTEFENSIK